MAARSVRTWWNAASLTNITSGFPARSFLNLSLTSLYYSEMIHTSANTYSRGFRGRRPVKVHIEESHMDDNSVHATNVNIARADNMARGKGNQRKSPDFRKFGNMSEKRFRDMENYCWHGHSGTSDKYELHREVETSKPEKFKAKLPADFKCEHLDEADKRYGPILRAAKSRKSRDEHGLILLEGKRLIRDALKCGADIKYVYFNRYEDLEDMPIENITKTAQFFKMKYHHIRLYSAVQTPPAVMAVCEKPVLEETFYDENVPLTLVCDNVRDPGNMGTLIRTAAAAGARQIVAMKGCADVWDPKVLRAGAGAHFQIPIFTSVTWEMISTYIIENPYVFMADNREESSEISAEETYSKHDNFTLYDYDSIDAETKTEKVKVMEKDSGEEVLIDSSYSEENAEPFRNIPFATKPFYDVDYVNPNGETVLIVGGETEGLSAPACRFTYDNYGCKVRIPMVGTLDSLNSSIAGSIILFEIKRQISAENVQ